MLTPVAGFHFMKKIKLTQNKYALVDNEDYEPLSKYSWYIVKSFNNIYACRHTIKSDIVVKRCHVLMHRQILKVTGKYNVDHINHNSLDNRKSNLRVCTHAQNSRNSRKNINNTSGYKGVYWSTVGNSWMAYIKYNYKLFNLGYFKDKKEAARSYDKKAKELFGEYAYLNFPNML